MSDYIDCEECAYHGEYDVDAEYICADCKSNICFDHMKPWPQPKWVKTEVIRYCNDCFSSRWQALGGSPPVVKRHEWDNRWEVFQ